MVIPDHLMRLARLGFFVCLLAVLLLALLPIHDIGAKSDKINHVFAFFVLGLLAGTAWPQGPRWRLCLGLLLVGGLIEVVQALVGRDAALNDLGADLIGVGLGILLLAFVRLRPMRLP